jgi:hypothetical protein
MDRYIGLDAHASSCTVATVGPSGRRLHSQVAETNARALIQVLRGIPRNRHLCLEEGTHASWLYEVLSPHVEEIVVAAVRESRGPKSDKLDAFGLAEQLRMGAVKRKVYKKRGEFGPLKHRAKAYTLLVVDSVRVQNRIKSLFRSRGVAVAAREELPGTGRDPDRAASSHRGDALPVQEQASVLGLLRSGDRDAELVGLGANPERGVGEGADPADPGLEPELEPIAEGDLQGSGHDGDRPRQRRALVSSLPAAAGRRHEAEPGEADAGPSGGVHHAGGLAQRGGVRPGKSRSGDLTARIQTGGRSAEGSRGVECPRHPETRTVQGRVSIEMLDRAHGPESPRIGYAPPGEPNEAMGHRVPDRRMVPAPRRRTPKLEGHSDDGRCNDPPTLPTGLQRTIRACGNYGRWRLHRFPSVRGWRAC